MKSNIHPTVNTAVKVKCSCGNKFSTISTIDSINVEVCSACHPFYTGKQKIISTGQVDKFKKRMKKTEVAKSKTTSKSKKEKRAKKDEKKEEDKKHETAK